MAETFDELRERAELLNEITRMEESAEWTDLDELQKRHDLLHEIGKAEGALGQRSS